MAENNPQSTSSQVSTSQETVHLPRIAIKYCTQCKWMLRAAYLAQELLSTFSTSLGEVSLIPSTGGVFSVTIATCTAEQATSTATIWDRKADGGFPETKELKSRVRNIIDPARDLGHVDRALKKNKQPESEQQPGGKPSGLVSAEEKPAKDPSAGDGKGGCEGEECGS